jgi:protein TonB
MGQESTMTTMAMPAVPAENLKGPTAHDRFKAIYRSVFWGSLILATCVHFAVFTFWPSMSADVVYLTAEELTAITLPPEIQIPAAPEAISRPAMPVVATGVVDETITIAPTTFESNPVSELPPPPSLKESTLSDLAAAPTFTPYTVRPEIKNRAEVAAVLAREYPVLMRDAGIGGTVLVWIFIDEAGSVVRTQVHTTSGHDALDKAALKVADIIEFTPALNRDKQVPVWISLPITFETRDE